VISPEDIRTRARKLWATGQPLRAAVTPLPVGSAASSELPPFFPCAIPFRRPSAQEWLDQFAELRAAVAVLEAHSKDAVGAGYRVTFRETAHQKLGRLRVPERITFETIEDLAVCAGEAAGLRRFFAVTDLIRTREPRLASWTAQRPFGALAADGRIPRLLDIIDYFQAHPRPNRYARELGIPGVDSKFIEENRAILAEWLDIVLPAAAVDAAARGLADHGFERRYGLRFEDPQIRFRWLDPSRALGGITDATVPLPQLAAYAPTCDHVVITENITNFLTLPSCANTLALFGRGYAIELVRAIPWLVRQPLHYWGDLDTHGFAILSRLRNRFPHTRSVLMDRDTLMAHRELWTEELSATRVLRDLEHLDPFERTLYDDLRHDRLGDRVRLEQERIPYPAVEVAMRNLSSAVAAIE
jgi:hypothetical protein